MVHPIIDCNGRLVWCSGEGCRPASLQRACRRPARKLLPNLYSLWKIGDPKAKRRFSWQGEIIDGSGSKRHFASHMHRWLDLQVIEVNRLSITGYTPNVWTPYQLPIHEEKKPNGNIISYTYVRWRGDKDYPRPVLLNTITAYNSDKTKVLGRISLKK